MRGVCLCVLAITSACLTHFHPTTCGHSNYIATSYVAIGRRRTRAQAEAEKASKANRSREPESSFLPLLRASVSVAKALFHLPDLKKYFLWKEEINEDTCIDLAAGI